ncbi:rho guanine nucleotide exchange factor 40 isoform X2 [Gadus morhua]|uniref:rho guanine nucleotide exchange factor 40 isoform X2 n=1 Tax=Gadus morhua TaxID=8049 RepID=UPI0011B43328|nr:rho guanine nucleotide exchange factor 40-like isoform X2 [Gadus morhua]
MGSEAVEDCVQGALSSLYPPFESTAPPLLSQVFSVLESTYQHDSLRYLLDYFVPAKHLLYKLQQHACSQYLGCLFLHSGWPLCLGEKVVVQLSTLDWRLLRSTDFYLQVVPFSTRCPRLALKCLAPGGRTVQEILVPESQHPLVFTTEWLHSVNRERGHKREVGGGLDTCLVSTCDGVVRLPWKEVVYPKFIHDPTEDPGLMSHGGGSAPGRLPSEGGSSGGGLGGWGGSSSGDPDSWSWDEEEEEQDDNNNNNTGGGGGGGTTAGRDPEPALPRRRRSEDGLGRTSRYLQTDGDYVELLEPRGGPDGGADARQAQPSSSSSSSSSRYLEMHAISKTKTLPLCRRSYAIKLKRGKAWGYGKAEGSGSFRNVIGGKRDVTSTHRGDTLPAQPSPPRADEQGSVGRSYSSSLHDSDDGEKARESQGVYFEGPSKERRPGVGKEREGVGLSQPCRDGGKEHEGVSDTLTSKGSQGLTNHKLLHTIEGQSDPGSQSDSVFEDADKPLSGDSDSTTPTSEAPECVLKAGTPLADLPGSGANATVPLVDGVGTKKCQLMGQSGTCAGSADPNASQEPEKNVVKTAGRDLSQGRDVRAAVVRAPRRKRKGKGAQRRARSGGRGNQKASKALPKAPPPLPARPSSAKPPITKDSQLEIAEESSGRDKEQTSSNQGAEETQPRKGSTETQTESDSISQSGASLSNHDASESGPETPRPVLSENPSAEAPPLLRELDSDLLQSGKFKLSGTVDRLGRALVVTETHVPEEGYSAEEMARVLSCYHRITRPAAKEKGLTVLIDSRQSPPSPLFLSALNHFQVLVPGGLGSVLVLLEEQQDATALELEPLEVHAVQGTVVLQQYVDRQQLLTDMGGDFSHAHADWLLFRLSLESLTERCEGALSLLGEALRSMDAEPMPDNIKAVPLSIEKHRGLMMDVLADQRLTELQQRGGAWLAGLTNSTSGLAHKSPDCKAALAATSDLYESVDDALHRLVRVSNQRGCDLEALGRLAALVDKLEKCDQEIREVQSQLEEYKDPPLSLSRLSVKQHKFKSFRETANDVHSESLQVLGQLEVWADLDWSGLRDVQLLLPPVRERLIDMSHLLSHRWSCLDNTQRLLTTLTEATQWCDAVSSASPSSSPLASLPPIPPSRFQDARSLALELGGGPLLDLWTQTMERYQRTVAQVKPRLLQGPGHAQGPQAGKGPKTPWTSSLWELMGPEGEGEGDWGGGGGGDGPLGTLQAWGSLASLFRPQTCSTLKIAEPAGPRKEGGGGASGGAGGGAGGFLQNLLNPAKKTVAADAPVFQKPPRRRHPSFDLQALLAPRRSTPTPPPAPPPPPCSTLAPPCRASPMSWLGRRAALVDPVVTATLAATVPMWGGPDGGGDGRATGDRGGGGGGAGGGVGGVRGGGVLIRGVEVSSKEVVDHTGSPRQHVLLGRMEREMGGERAGASTTTQSKLYLLWCRMLSAERQYVAVLKGAQETFLPLLELPDTPAALRGKADALFPCWAGLSSFHAQYLLPAMEGALLQSLLQHDCFSKYSDHFLQYSHYIRTKPELDSPLVTQASDFFKTKLPPSSPLFPMAFPRCLHAPLQRLEQYCHALQELGGLNSASDSALSMLRHAQRHGEDLRASDLIVGCPVCVSERGDLVRQGELVVCGGAGARRKKGGVRTVFLYQNILIFTKRRTCSAARTTYTHKHHIKSCEMGLTQSVGEDGLRFEVWVRQAPRGRDVLTLQTPTPALREAWAQDVARLLWTHAINNTELCLKESLCMGMSSKLLLDVTGPHCPETDSISTLTDRVHSSCSDSSSVGSQKEGGSPASGREPRRSSGSSCYTLQSGSPSTAV